MSAVRSAHVTGVVVFRGTGTSPQPVDINVQILGTYCLHTAISFSSGSSDTFELWRDVRGGFSGVGCPA